MGINFLAILIVFLVILLDFAQAEDFTAGMGVSANKSWPLPYSRRPHADIIFTNFSHKTTINGKQVFPQVFDPDTLIINLKMICLGMNNRTVNYPLYPEDNIIAFLKFMDGPSLIFEYPAVEVFTKLNAKTVGNIYTCGKNLNFDDCWKKVVAGTLGTGDGLGDDEVKQYIAQGMMVGTTMTLAVDGTIFPRSKFAQKESIFKQAITKSDLWRDGLSDEAKKELKDIINKSDKTYYSASNFHDLDTFQPMVTFSGNALIFEVSVAGFGILTNNEEIKKSGWYRFCGAFRSPLMLFFDDHMPGFTNQSSFPLRPGIKGVAWPEANHPGYFLFDTRKDACAKSGEQLFGEDREDANGMEALKKWDTNHNDYIDPKDKDFRSLALWQDKNGDGVCTKNEVKNLKAMGVTEISLAYRRIDLPFGDQAKASSRATFRYKKKGKIKEGKVYDIWLNVN